MKNVHYQGRDKTCGWRGQFNVPAGLFGSVAGWFMSVANRRMNQIVVDVMQIEPDDHVLEIGFGPGVAIEWIAERASRGFVGGIDPSDVMVSQATKRNQRFINDKRVELIQGDVNRLPWKDARFTKACAINCYQLWSSPLTGLNEIGRVLRPGGLVVIALRLEKPGANAFSAPGHREAELPHVVQLLTGARFVNVHVERHNAGREIACIVARRGR